MSARRALRICRVATVPFVVVLHMRPQLDAAVRQGHSVVVLCSDGPEAARIREMAGVHLEIMPIARRISPWQDLIALVRLYAHFRRERYDVVHSMTPKAGLLAAVAAFLAGIPCRMHHFTGQPWMEMKGIARLLARASDRLIARLNTTCFADSASQAAYLEAEGITSRGKVRVLGDGSFSGVDLARFDPVRLRGEGAQIRRQLGIPSQALVVGYVGRVTTEKGIAELIEAQATLSNQFDPWLLIVGPHHADIDPLPEEVSGVLKHGARARWVGYSEHPENYMVACDVLCLPSYREGFGIVLIEAAALGLPVVASRIVGVVDAVEDEVTGLLVEPKDPAALAVALGRLLADPQLRSRLGIAARARARARFGADRVNALLLEEYDRCAGRS